MGLQRSVEVEKHIKDQSSEMAGIVRFGGGIGCGAGVRSGVEAGGWDDQTPVRRPLSVSHSLASFQFGGSAPFALLHLRDFKGSRALAGPHETRAAPTCLLTW